MNYVELSKEIAHALRHEPWKYELELDEEGWTPVDQLLFALSEEERWQGIRRGDLEAMIAAMDKRRYELSGDRIRALYGHSIPMCIRKERRTPPDVLYHGTARRFLPAILGAGSAPGQGLTPQRRQYVHLSVDTETARTVGCRRDGRPALLVVDAKRACADGVPFYFGNEKVWLADSIAPEYLSLFDSFPAWN